MFHRYKPELDESNAESVARTTAMEAEYQYLLKKQARDNQDENDKTELRKLHALSPFTPIREAVQFQQGIQPPHPIIEPIPLSVEDFTYPNHVQHVSLDTDTGEDLVGLDFEHDGQTWTVTEIGFYEDHPVLYYKNKVTNEEEKSSVKEVRQWYNRTNLKQAANSISPSRKGFVNSLAEETFKAITTYDVKLPTNATKPTSYKKASNSPYPQWLRAEEKEKQGFLEFTAWEPLPSSQITAEIRKRALRYL